MPELLFDGLDQQHSGLTVAIAQTFHEAARICLARHHVAPVNFTLEVLNPASNTHVVLTWPAPNAQLRRAWANTNDATEAGACALGIAAVFFTRGLHVVARAETGTGADYFLAPEGQEPDDLEQCVRLELSGVDGGDVPGVQRRVTAKLTQARRGNVDTPAIAAVTGFKSQLIILADLR
jgi:hypothetical protein